jgi:predicted ArsR family transcriptional regulator
MSSRWRERLLVSTRGQVLGILRRGNATVTEMASEMGVTDNAVRSHLASLERDGLIEHRGVRRHIGKPAFVYGLTPEGEALFPKAYATVLGEVVDALEARLGEGEAEALLREVGRRLASGQRKAPTGKLRERVAAAVGVLEDLSGPVDVEEGRDGAVIRGSGCPLAGVVAERPALCRMVETLLGEVTGAQVTECCDRTGLPRCAFRIAG